MDSRFKNIDNELNFKLDQSQLRSFFDEIDTVALDNAFVEASQKMQYPYAAAYWQQFAAAEPAIIQNVYFSEAAKNYSAAYNPVYWTAAQEALASEGLNYQYKSAYWSEAEKLLVAADRKVFFRKWMAVATVLLLIGLTGQMLIGNRQLTNNKPAIVSSVMINSEKDTKTTSELSAIKGIEKGSNDLSSQKAKNVNLQSQNPSINNQPLAEIEKSTLSKKSTQKYSDNKLSHFESNRKGDQQPSIYNGGAPDISNPKRTANESLTKLNNGSEGITSNTPNNKLVAIVNSTSGTGSETRHTNPPVEKVLAPEISKIQLNQSLLLSTPNLWNNTNKMQEIEIKQKQVDNSPQVFVALQSGIGNSINTNQNTNMRTSLDVGITFNSSSLKNFSLSLVSGLDHQQLNNYTNSHNVVNYNRSGAIDYMSYAYEFQDLLKWQNGLLIGYKVSKRFNVKGGLAVDQYFTSNIKMYEQKVDAIVITDYNWGRNDFFNNTDIQILGQLEYILNSKLSAIASGEFGLKNQINLEKNPSLLPNQNRSVLIGVKYRLF